MWKGICSLIIAVSTCATSIIPDIRDSKHQRQYGVSRPRSSKLLFFPLLARNQIRAQVLTIPQPTNWTMSTRPPGNRTMPLHAPYPLPMANLGGLPMKHIDDPITAVFLFLFVLGAIAHMTILIVNLKRGHKFIISGLLFGFCMARITTCTMRLVFASYARNVHIAIAAQIFVAAGVLLLFIINLIFTQRVIRATHPHWAWSKPFSIILKAYYVSIVLMLIAPHLLHRPSLLHTLHHHQRYRPHRPTRRLNILRRRSIPAHPPPSTQLPHPPQTSYMPILLSWRQRTQSRKIWHWKIQIQNPNPSHHILPPHIRRRLPRRHSVRTAPQTEPSMVPRQSMVLRRELRSRDHRRRYLRLRTS